MLSGGCCCCCRFSVEEVHPQEQSDAEAEAFLRPVRLEGGDRQGCIRGRVPVHREGLGQTIRSEVRGRGQQRGGTECDEGDRDYEGTHPRQTATASRRLPDRLRDHHGHGVVSTWSCRTFAHHGSDDPGSNPKRGT